MRDDSEAVSPHIMLRFSDGSGGNLGAQVGDAIRKALGEGDTLTPEIAQVAATQAISAMLLESPTQVWTSHEGEGDDSLRHFIVQQVTWPEARRALGGEDE